MTAVLSSANLTKQYRFGGQMVHAVSEVSLSMDVGDVVVLQGPSGSGKSTLLNLLTGWERPDSGQIRFEGREIDPARLSWSDIAIVPQRLGLMPELTAAENVTLPTRYAGVDQDPLETLAGFGLAGLGDAYLDELSQGQQQRVAIARAAVVSPTVLIADEPTSSQDEESARLILERLVELAGRGTACLVASHDPIIGEYATRVIELRDGRVQASVRVTDKQG